MAKTWQIYTSAFKAAGLTIGDATTQLTSLNAGLRQVISLEAAWKQLHMNLSPVAEAYETLTDRAAHLADVARQRVDQLHTASNDLDSVTKKQSEGVEKTLSP